MDEVAAASPAGAAAAAGSPSRALTLANTGMGSPGATALVPANADTLARVSETEAELAKAQHEVVIVRQSEDLLRTSLEETRRELTDAKVRVATRFGVGRHTAMS